MICLLRCISGKLCCTSILQRPREPRPLAGKCSKSQRATTEEDERASSPTKEPVDAFDLKAGKKKGRKRASHLHNHIRVIVNGNKPNGIVEQFACEDSPSLRGALWQSVSFTAQKQLIESKLGS